MSTLIGPKSEFSIGESILSAEDIVKSAYNAGFDSVAVADTNSLSVMTKLAKAANDIEADEMKVIFGATLTVVDSLAWRRPKKGEAKRSAEKFWMPSVYVKNESGLRDLMALLSKANDEEHFYFRPRISLHELIQVMDRGNVVVTSGSINSLFAHPNYVMILSRIRSVLTGNKEALFFLEMPVIDSPYYIRICEQVVKHSDPLFFRPLITFPSLYKANEQDLRDTMSCITSRTKVHEKWRNEAFGFELPTDRNRHTAIDGMEGTLVSHKGCDSDLTEDVIASALNNAAIFHMFFTYEWKGMPISLPEMSDDPMRTLKEKCVKGFKQRLTQEVLGHKPDTGQLSEYKDRMSYELRVLESMGFENYFLLVEHITSWCRDQGIIVGPGRGSVGGSLVAFLIGITDVDPIRFGLIFERFINPDRLDLPDIDLDFMSSRREEVIKHLREEFGSEYVAGISNYTMLGAASSIRSVGSAHSLTPEDLSPSKTVPTEHGQPVSLKEAVIKSPELENFAVSYPDIYKQAESLEGKLRGYGQHAGAVVVGGSPLIERSVLENRGGQRIINWDKRVCEDFGLVKLDILGLQTLDILSLAKEKIRQRHGVDVVYQDLPLDDTKVLKAFGDGDTTGIFQFESGGMRGLLQDLASAGPLDFEECAAVTALYRPGPLEAGLTDKYIQIRQGASFPEYVHPYAEPALRSTHSVMVYQEQTMQIARDLAGFSMSEADTLRKAMGKKDAKLMSAQRQKFVDGCADKAGLEEDVAANVFDQIEEFAGYAFNASHSVEYTVISYWNMWLKVYYPEEFFAAALSILSEEKFPGLVRDLNSKGLDVVAPDINVSGLTFEIDDNRLCAPFQSIKGCSQNGAKAILKAREEVGGKFESYEQFEEAVDKRKCNVRIRDSLNRVGAFARLDPSQVPVDSLERLKDQKELLPGIIVKNVQIDRQLKLTKENLLKVKDLRVEIESCELCSLAGSQHCTPRIGKNAKIMIVMDSPNWTEEEAGRFGVGEACESLNQALSQNGIGLSDVYITSLVKAAKPKGEQLSNEMINGCARYLESEIEALDPQVIVAMGGSSIRHLHPEARGGWEELCGQCHYDPETNRTLVFGMNPLMVHFEPKRQSNLSEVFSIVADMLPNK